MARYSDIMVGGFASEARVAAYDAAKRNPGISQFFDFDGDRYEVSFRAGDPALRLGDVIIGGTAGSWTEFCRDGDKKRLNSIKHIHDDQG